MGETFLLWNVLGAMTITISSPHPVLTNAQNLSDYLYKQMKPAYGEAGTPKLKNFVEHGKDLLGIIVGGAWAQPKHCEQGHLLYPQGKGEPLRHHRNLQ